MYIESEKQLRSIYGHPKGRTVDKQLPCLEEHSINFISHSPFIVISTHAKAESMDCSPRGGGPGFTKIINNSCMLIPDGKGNKRLDSLLNIIETGSIGCLFLIPGIDETLRINGTARVSTSSAYLSHFSDNRNPPSACIEVNIEEVYLHCAKALMRSRLWDSESQKIRSEFPSMGKMINDQLSISEEPESQADMVTRYTQDL